MKRTYDPCSNIAFLRLQERTADVATVHLSDGLNIDIAPDGTVSGIELLNASAQFRRDASGQLLVVNEASGASCSLPLTD
jgi:uncharacterized protein YuzE